MLLATPGLRILQVIVIGLIFESFEKTLKKTLLYIFYRFVKWLKEKKLPKELEGYCKTVLNYLSQNSSDFMAEEEQQTDEEDSSDEDPLETDTQEEEDSGDEDSEETDIDEEVEDGGQEETDDM